MLHGVLFAPHLAQVARLPSATCKRQKKDKTEKNNLLVSYQGTVLETQKIRNFPQKIRILKICTEEWFLT